MYNTHRRGSLPPILSRHPKGCPEPWDLRPRTPGVVAMLLRARRVSNSESWWRALVSRETQIQGRREVPVIFGLRRVVSADPMAEGHETRQAPPFRLVGIDRIDFVIAPAGMGDVIGAAADRALVPAIDQIEHQRRLHADGRMQAGSRAPGAEPHAGH